LISLHIFIFFIDLLLFLLLLLLLLLLFYYKISIFYKFHHLIKLILSIYYILSNTIDDIYFIVPQSLLYLYQISSILYIYNFKQYEPIVIPIICDIGMPNNIIVIPYTKSYIIFNQF
jgi:hypothetical protein